MTDPSPVAISVMCIVVVSCLAFQLIMIYRASVQPNTPRPRRENMATGVRGGRHLAVGGRSVAPDRDAPVWVLPEAAAEDPAEAAAKDPAADPAEATTDRPDVPASRPSQDDGAPVPSQRSGHADQAARATTGQHT